MRICEWVSLLLFVIATVLSFTRQLYQAFLPDLKPAYIFIICGILSFLIRKEDGNPLMVWKSVQKKIIWDLIFIFAGGLAAGTLMNESHAADSIGILVSKAGTGGGLFMVFIILTFTLLLSDVTSNTATAAIAMPTVISITTGLGLNPLPYIYIASIGVNLSFMFPTSIRAVPVGYGLSPKYMFKKGLIFTILLLASLTLLCNILLKYYPAFNAI